MELHSPNEFPFKTVSHLAIAIGGTEQQSHIGLLYKSPGSVEPLLLHLAFHHLLRSEAPEPDMYCWADCTGFVEDELCQLAIWCGSIWAANKNKIPYGLAYSSGPHFSSSGLFVPGTDGTGLTCATFVLALFRDFGFSIVDTESWQSRPEEDRAWQLSIIHMLRQHQSKYNISQRHIDAQVDELGIATRYKPEEVAACACHFDGHPVSFSVAETAGIEVKSSLLSLRARGCTL